MFHIRLIEYPASTHCIVKELGRSLPGGSSSKLLDLLLGNEENSLGSVLALWTQWSGIYIIKEGVRRRICQVFLSKD
jgi:hypothetical protein